MTSLEAPIQQLHSTTDYSRFKQNPHNRPLNPDHVKKLVEAIQKKDLLSCNPIIVDRDMYVIEGQHRLKAAELLEKPIYYIINEESQDEDIILMNSTRKNWGLENYCKFYINKGNINYKNIKEYSVLYDVSLNVLLNMGIAGRCNGPTYLRFKSGDYKFPTDKEFEHMSNALEHKVKIIEMLKSLSIPADIKRVVGGDAFQKALINFMFIDDVIPSVLSQKLKGRAEYIKTCATQHAYMIMLKEMYNYRNPNPID